jgi:hypothetical protein
MLNAIRHLKQVVPHLNTIFNTGRSNDTVRDLNLSDKSKPKSLVSTKRLESSKANETEICFFLNHYNEFKGFFFQENDLVFCNDVFCVIEACRTATRSK